MATSIQLLWIVSLAIRVSQDVGSPEKEVALPQLLFKNG